MKETHHKVINTNSNNMININNQSINLIVTSPPYPMIKMWDESFSEQNKKVKSALTNGDAIKMFNEMHTVLEEIWDECDRVLANNGFICINVGDATRTINNKFQMFPNHTKIINYFFQKGYCVLPDIIWRKQSNSPTKFMGSGMLPAGAYITYEHEYILIFRKGGKREFHKDDMRKLRQQSAYFWEERNLWFSDLWELKGTTQKIKKGKTRERSAAYPFELAYRLINMYSVKGDTILDPFLGTATTTLASIAAERNSIGFEREASLIKVIDERILNASNKLKKRIRKRIDDHVRFIDSLPKEQLDKCYNSNYHNFKIKTMQERNILIRNIKNIQNINNENYTCEYEDIE